MTNHVWVIGFDEDAEQFYCRSLGGETIVETKQPQSATLDPERREVLAKATAEANKRGLRIVSLTQYGDETAVILHGD